MNAHRWEKPRTAKYGPVRHRETAKGFPIAQCTAPPLSPAQAWRNDGSAPPHNTCNVATHDTAAYPTDDTERE